MGEWPRSAAWPTGITITAAYAINVSFERSWSAWPESFPEPKAWELPCNMARKTEMRQERESHFEQPSDPLPPRRHVGQEEIEKRSGTHQSRIRRQPN